MLAFVKNKLLSKKWMVISLLVGNILLISIAACSPMYSDAVLQRMLNRDFTERMELNGRQPGVVRFSVEYSELARNRETNFAQYEAIKTLSKDFAAESPVPVIETVTEHYRVATMSHKASGGNYHSNFDGRIEALEGFEEHVNLVTGELPQIKSDPLVLEAVVSQTTLMKSNLWIGEEVVLEKLVDPSTKEPLRIKITGIIEPKEDQDPFWLNNPNNVRNFLYVNTEEFMTKMVNDINRRFSFAASFSVVLDYQEIGSSVYDILDLCDAYSRRAKDIQGRSFDAEFYSLLTNYLSNANKLDVTLLVLQVPIFLLLIAFIFMVSGQLLSMEENEISVIKSRGAAKRQILQIYLVQSAVLAAISLVAALPLAYLICQVLGSANAFLEFVQRRALPARFYLPVWLFAIGAWTVSVLTMVIPAFRYSKVGIVDHKRAKHKKKSPLWQKLFLDIILLGVSLYGLYSYNQQSGFLAQQLEATGSLDPLLYMCSSMFILGCALFVLRIFPLLIKLIFSIFRKLWSPALYASFLRMLRSRGSQNFIMGFLILTLALGIFSAEAARTINSNAEEEIRYANGADIVVQEKWAHTIYSTNGEDTTVYEEPDPAKYDELLGNGAASITKVQYVYNVAPQGIKLENSRLMAIDTKKFGETAYMKSNLLPEHWYNYLNAMASDPAGVLVSTSYRDQLGYRLGDPLILACTGKDRVFRGIIYGFVDYWPTLTPSADQKSYFVVANYNEIRLSWGEDPYMFWIKNEGPSSQYIYDFAEKNGLEFVTFTDTNADIIALKNNPTFQATNGILTVGFIVVLVLCSVGFLIYWILSIQSRALQFGIFRAMGMSMREVISMLASEQLFMSGTSIVMGAIIGKVAGNLFVPLIQVAYSADQVLPLEVTSRLSDQIQLYSVVGVVMIICMVILGWMVKRIKIAQALKLGED